MKTVVEAILDMAAMDEDSLEAVKAALQAAQKNLVLDVLKDDSKSVMWVHAYAEVSDKLHATLTRVTTKAAAGNPGNRNKKNTFRWYFQRAAGLSEEDQRSATAFYTELGAVLQNVNPDQWLTAKLNAHNAPLFFELTQANFESHADPVGRLHDVYKKIFSYGPPESRYVHLASPLRATKLSEEAGISGVYLLLRDGVSVEKLPQCLYFHLQAFVHALVIAQQWRISKHLKELEQDLLAQRKKVLRDAEILVSNRLVLIRMADAIKLVRSELDPLAVDTSAFDRIHLDALSIFDPEKGNKHDIKEWTSGGATLVRKVLGEFVVGAREALKDAVGEAAENGAEEETVENIPEDEAADCSLALVERVVGHIEGLLHQAAGAGDNLFLLESALRIVKAVSRQSVATSCLVPFDANVYKASDKVTTMKPFHGGSEGRPLEKRWLIEALSSLLKSQGNRKSPWNIQSVELKDVERGLWEVVVQPPSVQKSNHSFGDLKRSACIALTDSGDAGENGKFAARLWRGFFGRTATEKEHAEAENEYWGNVLSGESEGQLRFLFRAKFED